MLCGIAHFIGLHCEWAQPNPCTPLKLIVRQPNSQMNNRMKYTTPCIHTYAMVAFGKSLKPIERVCGAFCSRCSWDVSVCSVLFSFVLIFFVVANSRCCRCAVIIQRWLILTSVWLNSSMLWPAVRPRNEFSPSKKSRPLRRKADDWFSIWDQTVGRTRERVKRVEGELRKYTTTQKRYSKHTIQNVEHEEGEVEEGQTKWWAKCEERQDTRACILQAAHV